jgi:hypothetical protein
VLFMRVSRHPFDAVDDLAVDSETRWVGASWVGFVSQAARRPERGPSFRIAERDGSTLPRPIDGPGREISGTGVFDA